MGSIVRPLSHSLSFEAIDLKYLLNPFAITRLSSITFPSIIKEGFILTLCLPRISLIIFHVSLLFPSAFLKSLRQLAFLA